MGDKLQLACMSNMQLQEHIRRLSKNSACVMLTFHAQERMLERSVSDWEVFECLRSGVIQRPAVRDSKKHTIRCRMEHFGSARNLAVIVALDEEEPELIVVTVLTKRGG